MLRIADVIQLNVGTEFKFNDPEIQNFTHSKGTSFRMNEAFTYVEIDTDIQVKALLLSNSMFTRGSGDPTKKPINYWTYKYKTIAGY